MHRTDYVNLCAWSDVTGRQTGLLVVAGPQTSITVQATFGPFDGPREVLAAGLLALKALSRGQDHALAEAMFQSYANDYDLHAAAPRIADLPH